LRNNAGFTLIELLVVVLIIGILAGISVPYYLKAEETSKANQGSALANMVATANRMYAVDHGGVYASGVFTGASCPGNSTNCTSALCPSSGGPASECCLIYCGYLAEQDWDNSPYEVQAVANAACGIGSCSGGSGDMACVARQGSNTAPYNNWGYSVNSSGVTSSCGGAPTPPSQ